MHQPQRFNAHKKLVIPTIPRQNWTKHINTQSTEGEKQPMNMKTMFNITKNERNINLHNRKITCFGRDQKISKK